MSARAGTCRREHEVNFLVAKARATQLRPDLCNGLRPVAHPVQQVASHRRHAPIDEVQLVFASRRRCIRDRRNGRLRRRLASVGIGDEDTPVSTPDLDPPALKAQHAPRRLVDRRRRDRVAARTRYSLSTQPVTRPQSPVGGCESGVAHPLGDDALARADAVMLVHRVRDSTATPSRVLARERECEQTGSSALIAGHVAASLAFAFRSEQDHRPALPRLQHPRRTVVPGRCIQSRRVLLATPRGGGESPRRHHICRGERPERCRW